MRDQDRGSLLETVPENRIELEGTDIVPSIARASQVPGTALIAHNP
jgi:hypothetical protein